MLQKLLQYKRADSARHLVLIFVMLMAFAHTSFSQTFYFDIVGPTTICPSSTYTYTCPYPATWTIRDGWGIERTDYGQSINVQWTSRQGSLVAIYEVSGQEPENPSCYYDDQYPPNYVCDPVYTYSYTYQSRTFAVSSISGNAFSSNGNGSYCSGTLGSITCASTQTGANYQLKFQNGANVGGSMAGTGASLVWNNLGPATYELVATRLSDGCTVLLNSVNIASVASVGGTIIDNGATVGCLAASGTLGLTGNTGNIVRWESNTGSGWVTANTVNNSYLNYNVTTTTHFRALVVASTGTADCAGAYSSVATITVHPSSVGGSTSVVGGTNYSFCSPASGSVQLAGNTGSVVRWESLLLEDGMSWTAVANSANSSSLSFSNLTKNTNYRAVVKSGTCPETYSSVSSVALSYPTGGGQVYPANTFLYTTSATGQLSHEIYGDDVSIRRWEKNEGSGWTAINLVNPVYDYSVNQNAAFRVISKSGVCSEEVSTVGNIILFAPPVVSPAVPQTITYGGSVTLTANGPYHSYQWFLNSNPIVGATSQQYIAREPGNYFVQVKGSASAPTANSAVTAVTSVVGQYEGKMNGISQTTILTEGITESTSLYTLQLNQLLQTISYQDGLGRTFQSIGVGTSPQGGDVVAVSAASKQGLADTTFLPYATSTATGTYRPNAIRGSAAHTSYATSEQYLFYQNTAKVAQDASPFARTLYATDPTLRVTEQGAAGAAWQPGTNKTVRSISAWNNATTYKVRFWKTDGTTTGNWPDNSVAVSIATDENGNQVRTYTNTLGQTVLKQVQMDETLEGISTPWLETYYIYDVYGRVIYQVPPKAMKVLGTGTTLDAKATSVAELIYTYLYDAKGRLVEKKAPGAARGADCV